METTIGGDRLGSGKKMKVWMDNYNRSTHDMSYLWRSTMASGTLVPFMVELALPGDTFDIDLGCNVLTHPTIGPLFGSYKVQLDVFQVPIRLYNSGLHNNLLNVGMKMSEIKLPQVKVFGTNVFDFSKPIDNQQVNPSSLLSYLNIRGIGSSDDNVGVISRQFNAVPYCAYWDIYKNYYANKSEEIGAMIHTPSISETWEVGSSSTGQTFPILTGIPDESGFAGSYQSTDFQSYSSIIVQGSADMKVPLIINNIWIAYIDSRSNVQVNTPLIGYFNSYEIDETNNTVTFYNPIAPDELSYFNIHGIYWNDVPVPVSDGKPYITTFPLVNIDTFRMDLLKQDYNDPLIIDYTFAAPHGLPLQFSQDESLNYYFSLIHTQEGLALKTYQSDLFNNWLSTEWIDGQDGISQITAVSTAGDNFTIDELNLAKKVYDMLNRIALSGGSYDDWLGAVYTHERTRGQESPMYIGGLIKELAFQEVISNSASGDEPLGTLAGRGVLTHKHKGGSIIAKVNEPSYLIGIVSITPRIDYSQGNKWDTNLKTMDDLHKPALDQIGFQSLITDQLAWFDTTQTQGASTFKEAGKQPAWINYMTNVNQVRGNFADPNSQMFMTLNRRYEAKVTGNKISIKDLTTYIDPSKFNHVFADTRLDAQNFWTQISIDMIARRKMSAKVIPNL